jgi:hypothetical protein
VVSAATACRRRVPAELGLVIDGDRATLPSRGRVDVRIELAEPVRMLRVLGEPVDVRVLELASDDPDALVSAIRRGALEPGGARRSGAVGGFELAGPAAELAYP